MQGLIYTLILLASVAFLILAGYLLIKKGWFISWLKGTIGIASFLLVAFLLLAALDFSTYKHLTSEQVLATVSVYQLDDQLYDVTLVVEDQPEYRYEIKGDQWQLDVRLFTWKGPIAALGQKPLYRLERLSGRYTSLEQALSAERSIYEIGPESTLDVWKWFYGADLWLDANYGSAVYMPLENGAVYAINLTATGVVARPLNGIADKVLKRPW